MRVFVTRPTWPDLLQKLRPLADLDVWLDTEAPPPDVLRRRAAAADGLISQLQDPIDERLLSACSLRFVSQAAVGYDNIDVAACSRHGVVVCHTPDVLTETTADLAFALLLAAARRLVEGDRLVRAGGWTGFDPQLLLGTDVHHKTLGIVGMGRIGQAMARRAHGFGMRVVFASRRPTQVANCTQLPLRELLTQSDFLSLHLPLTSETRGLIGAEELDLLPQGAVVINTGRGPLIDEQALLRSLQRGHLGAVGLDVYAQEPLSPESPWLHEPRAVLLPHIGSATLQTRRGMAALAVRQAAACLRGELPAHALNPEAAASWTQRRS